MPTDSQHRPIDWGDIYRRSRDEECTCGHARRAHACTFTGVRCICGCVEFRSKERIDA